MIISHRKTCPRAQEIVASRSERLVRSSLRLSGTPDAKIFGNGAIRRQTNSPTNQVAEMFYLKFGV